jgi:hypothetical protein
MENDGFAVDQRVPSDEEEVYYELLGARVHTEDLADRITDAPTTPVGIARMLEQSSLVLGDLHRLVAAMPVDPVSADVVRKDDLATALDAAASTFGDLAERLAGGVPAGPAPMSAEEIAAYHEAVARLRAAAVRDNPTPVRVTFDTTRAEWETIRAVARQHGIGVGEFVRRSASSAARSEAGPAGA